jgi:hypothetical protein
VDIFNAITGTWHTAQLSVLRDGLGATSLPSQGLALFAGGQGTLVLKSIVGCVTGASAYTQTFQKF